MKIHLGLSLSLSLSGYRKIEHDPEGLSKKERPIVISPDHLEIVSWRRTNVTCKIMFDRQIHRVSNAFFVAMVGL